MAAKFFRTALAGLASGLGVLYIYNKYLKNKIVENPSLKNDSESGTKLSKDEISIVENQIENGTFSVANMTAEEIEALPAEQVAKISLDDWSLEVADTGTAQKSADSPYTGVVKNIYNRAIVMSTRKWTNLQLNFSKLTSDAEEIFNKKMDNFFTQYIT